MQPTQTGIAVALALAVVASFFIFPGFWFFSAPAAPSGQAAPDTTITTSTSTTPTMPTEPVTQLMMKDEVVGTGAAAAAGDTVTVNYVGSLTSGQVFDASANHGSSGFTF